MKVRVNSKINIGFDLDAEQYSKLETEIPKLLSEICKILKEDVVLINVTNINAGYTGYEIQ